MKVLFTHAVRRQLDELETILYEKGYLSYEESAHRYVDELVRDITTSLPTRPHHPAPLRYDRYGAGMYYAAFRKNRTTMWYAFFTLYDSGGEAVYLVRYIGNNHTDARYLD